MLIIKPVQLILLTFGLIVIVWTMVNMMHSQNMFEDADYGFTELEPSSNAVISQNLLHELEIDLLMKIRHSQTLDDLDRQHNQVTIMPAMQNSTDREELGRATWRLLHTMASRYPAIPSREDQLYFQVFVLMLARLYPCGDCAAHFQKLLSEHPPVLTNRIDAVKWMCQVHNIVNKRLAKPQFDCEAAAEHWKCGCSAAD